MSNEERRQTRRQAVRGILMTPDRRVLLIQLRESMTGFQIWMTPGGGLDAGEDAIVGLRRELFEETGLRRAEIGPHVWSRDHKFEWNGRHVDQQESFYLVETEFFEPNGDGNPDAGEQAGFLAFRWWRVEEILASDETFSPTHLGHHLAQILRHGPPETPFAISA